MTHDPQQPMEGAVPPVSTASQLAARIAGLLQDSEAGFAARRLARDEQMERLCQKQVRFDALAEGLLERIVRPRLEVLSGSFRHCGCLIPLTGGHGLAVPFAHTEEFPAHARVEVGIGHDLEYDRAWCAYSASIIPILMEYERDRCLDIDVSQPDESRLAQFLDARIEGFVRSYLRICEPESLYQRDRLVTDPVCGMTFRRADAHSVLEHDGRKVFFCADSCRRQFEAACRQECGGRP